MKALRLALIALPGLALAAIGRASPIALLIAAAVSAFFAWSVAGLIDRRLRTVSAVLAAYREGDLATRARDVDPFLHPVVEELNRLGDTLRRDRFGELEAWSLLRKVMAEVDVVVLAIDDDKKIRLANEAAERALGKDLVGQAAPAELLEGEAPRAVAQIGSTPGPWELRRGSFRLAGEPQTLVVLSDVSRALRENERDAWRKLIRVMGHEINNSLSPIRSISESLTAQLSRPRGPDWEADLAGGLAVIGRRAEALGRFLSSYAALARLPAPRRAPVAVRALVEKIAALETRAPVVVSGGPDVTLEADSDQLEQALINLVKNAAEASLESKGRVALAWSVDDQAVTISIEDDGPGVDATANLFVPFFTTKPDGSGIGLVLSRQIVEAHDGKLSLSSRTNGRGAVARIRLPLAVA